MPEIIYYQVGFLLFIKMILEGVAFYREPDYTRLCLSEKILFWPLLFNYLGFRALWERLQPPKEKLKASKKKPRRPASTLIFWLGSFYLAIFGLASQRYENRVDVIENRANALVTQIASGSKNAFSELAFVQHMWCPPKPKLWKPLSSINCLLEPQQFEELTPELFRNNKWRFIKSELRHQETIRMLRRTVVNWKNGLQEIELRFAQLQRSDLKGANLKGADLKWVNLEGAWLNGACLKDADLKGAILIGTNLTNAHLEGASLQLTMRIVDFIDGEVKTMNNLTAEQLVQAKTLYRATLSPILEQELRKKYPEDAKRLLDTPPCKLND